MPEPTADRSRSRDPPGRRLKHWLRSKVLSRSADKYISGIKGDRTRMTTLSPFLWTRSGKDDSAAQKQAEALNRIISILLQGIGLHTFNFDEARFLAFGKSLRKIRMEFERASDEATALLAAGAAIRMLEEHSEAAAHHGTSLRQEMAGVLELLSNTLLEVAHAAPETTLLLKGLEKELATAGSAELMAISRERLAACLTEVRAAALAAPLNRKSGPGQEAETDGVTGLPDPGYATRAAISIWNRRQDYYVAVLALERLETINLRFGFKAGDQMLLMLSQHVTRHLTADDLLFRWRGPCLGMLIERQIPEAIVAAEITRIATTRLEAPMMFREREVIVPISISWNLLPLSSILNAEDLVRQMNDFAGSRSRSGRHVLAAAM